MIAAFPFVHSGSGWQHVSSVTAALSKSFCIFRVEVMLYLAPKFPSKRSRHNRFLRSSVGSQIYHVEAQKVSVLFFLRMLCDVFLSSPSSAVVSPLSSCVLFFQ